MSSLLQRLTRQPARAARALWPADWHLPAPWQRPLDLTTDHGHLPFGAWEAELAAYARLRTGATIKVQFALATEGQWADTIHLARPSGNVPVAQAFDEAELALEHLLAHYRHGSKEAALFWQTFARPGEPITLPWAPWDHVALPAGIVRTAITEAVPALQVPVLRSAWRAREHDAARWLAAAWADGVHRRLEVSARPGLADRLPVPPKGKRPRTWDAVIHGLAAGNRAFELPAGPVRREVEALASIAAPDQDGSVRAVFELLLVLSKANALLPSHEQRPPWLTPMWGRWQHAGELRAALDHLARSPTSAAMASATAAGRAFGSGMASPYAPRSAQSPRIDPRQSKNDDDPQRWGKIEDAGEKQPTSSRLPQRDTQEHPAGNDDVGDGHEPPAQAAAPPKPATSGATSRSAGAGALGALHVVEPSPEDRVAYWQLRGALAPQIERLVELLQAASDAYYVNRPHRLQRQGRLDRTRLPAAMSGRERVFTRFVHEPEPAHALCLVLDCSASMVALAEQLRESAILVEAAAAIVGARVSAFTFGPAWERLKPAAENSPLLTLGRELHPRGGTPFGQAVAEAADWLAYQPYQKKRLWIITDGQWSARDRAHVSWEESRLRDVVVWVLGETAPEPPTPAMRVVAVPTLDALVHLAPRYFWGDGSGAPQADRIATSAAR